MWKAVYCEIPIELLVDKVFHFLRYQDVGEIYKNNLSIYTPAHMFCQPSCQRQMANFILFAPITPGCLEGCVAFKNPDDL